MRSPVAAAPTEGSPLPAGGFGDLVVDEARRHLLVTTGDKVSVFDFDGQFVENIDGVPGATRMAIAGDDLFVMMAASKSIARIDLTIPVVARVYVFASIVGDDLAVVDGAVWTLGGGGYSLQRLDPVTGAVVSVPGETFTGTQYDLDAVPGRPHRLIVTPWIGSRVEVDVSTSPLTVVHASMPGGDPGANATAADGAMDWSIDSSNQSAGFNGTRIVERSHDSMQPTGRTYLATIGARMLVATPAGGGLLVSAADAPYDRGIRVSSIGKATNTHLIEEGRPLLFRSLAVSPDGGRAFGVSWDAATGTTFVMRVFDLQPVIATLTPASASFAGSPTAALTGEGLGVVDQVLIDGAPIPTMALSSSPSRFEFSLPSGVSAGTHEVAVVTATGTSAPFAFTMPLAAPVVSPTSTPVPIQDWGRGDMVVDHPHGLTFVSGQDSVVALDVTGHIVMVWSGLYGAHDMQVEGDDLYVVQTSGGVISRINLSTMTVTGSWNLGFELWGRMAIQRGSAWFFAPVPADASYRLMSLDLGTGIIANRGVALTGGRVRPVTGTTNHLILYGGSGVIDYDTEAGVVVRTNSAFGFVGGLVTSADGATLYAGTGVDIVELDRSSLTITRRYPGGDGPVAWSPLHGGLVAGAKGYGCDGSFVYPIGSPAPSHQFRCGAYAVAFAADGSSLLRLEPGAGSLRVSRLALQPSVSSAWPASAPVDTLTTVAFGGQGLGSTTSVLVDGVPDGNLTTVTPSTVRLALPSGLAVGVHSLVVHSDAFGDLAPISFTVTPPLPELVSATPSSGGLTGGTTVQLSGSHLTGVTSVRFGSTYAAFTILNDDLIEAKAPAHGAGAVGVTVSVPWGSRTVDNLYTYVAAPTVTSINPVEGSTAGATEVTIIGSGFTTATNVQFGTTPASSFTVTSPTTIVAVAPPHPAGIVDVRVVNPGGSSAPTAAGAFTYRPPPAGTITGQVRGLAGGLGGMYVVLSPSATPSILAYTVSAPDGSYALPNVVPGSYKILVLDPDHLRGAASHYSSQFYGGGWTLADFATAPTLTVAASMTLALEPMTLSHNSRGVVTGVVTDGTSPLGGMYVVVSPSSALSNLDHAVTRSDGSFSLANIVPGTYKILFLDLAHLQGLPSHYVSEFYDNGGTTLADFATATEVTVAAGALVELNPVSLAHS